MTVKDFQKHLNTVVDLSQRRGKKCGTNYSESSAARILKKLGFKYDVAKRNIYIDGHESDDVVAARRKLFAAGADYWTITTNVVQTEVPQPFKRFNAGTSALDAATRAVEVHRGERLVFGSSVSTDFALSKKEVVAKAGEGEETKEQTLATITTLLSVMDAPEVPPSTDPKPRIKAHPLILMNGVIMEMHCKLWPEDDHHDGCCAEGCTEAQMAPAVICSFCQYVFHYTCIPAGCSNPSFQLFACADCVQAEDGAKPLNELRKLTRCGNCRQPGHKRNQCYQPGGFCGSSAHTSGTCPHNEKAQKKDGGGEDEQPAVANEARPCDTVTEEVLASQYIFCCPECGQWVPDPDPTTECGRCKHVTDRPLPEWSEQARTKRHRFLLSTRRQVNPIEHTWAALKFGAIRIVDGTMATLRVFVPHYLENLSVKDVQLQQQRCQRYADCYKRGLDGYEAATEVEKAKRGRARSQRREFMIN